MRRKREKLEGSAPRLVRAINSRASTTDDDNRSSSLLEPQSFLTAAQMDSADAASWGDALVRMEGERGLGSRDPGRGRAREREREMKGLERKRESIRSLSLSLLAHRRTDESERRSCWRCQSPFWHPQLVPCHQFPPLCPPEERFRADLWSQRAGEDHRGAEDVPKHRGWFESNHRRT